MRVYVLDLASPAAAVMLKEPELWPQIVSSSNTVPGLKADLIEQQVAQDTNFRLQLCTDPSTNIWTYESAFQEHLRPSDTLYVRMEPWLCALTNAPTTPSLTTSHHPPPGMPGITRITAVDKKNL